MKIKKHTYKSRRIISEIIIISVFLILGTLLFSLEANAVYEYTPMENIPGFEDVSDFPTYILSITKFAIWAVGIAALFMITVGGFMYMTSAGNTSRMDSAKRVIFDAVIGLIVALSAWLLLFVINPDLVRVNISLKAVELPKPSEYISGPYAPIVPPGPPGACYGLATQPGIDAQCKDVSATLSGLLACLAKNLPSLIINSISDSAGYAFCKYTWNKPPCAHGSVKTGCIPGGICTSCHYGGKTCTDGSYAVDISTRNLSASQISSAAASCGAHYVLNEGNHVHVSVGAACGCN